MPDEFAFPFEPYAIQVDFMKSLYEALERSKIGIFESPTGTVRSSSFSILEYVLYNSHVSLLKMFTTFLE